MASSNSDDLMPRPLPKPSPIEEICARPEVPEISLVFDCSSSKPSKANSPLVYQSNTFQQQSTSSLDSNNFIPRLEHHCASPSSPKSLNPSSLANTALRTPLKLDDRGVLAAKKVSFSPLGPKNDLNNLELNATETQQHNNENAACHCNHDTIIGSQYHRNSKCTSDEKKACTCSCSNDSFDYSWDHPNSIQRILKNFERKMNTKVSYDDLQKTELKIENILLKHKCKYDKLGENSVTKDEFNRVIKNFESQINLLQLRVEELTQKLSYSSHFIGSSYNHEIKKCNCSDDLVSKRSHPTQVVNTVKRSNHNCCSSHHIPNGNLFDNGKNYVNGNSVIPTNNYAQFNVLPVNSDNQKMQTSKIYQDCCNKGNFQNIEHHVPTHDKNFNQENHVVIQTTNTYSPPEKYDQAPVTVHKSNANKLVTHQPQHYPNQLPYLSQDQQTLNEKNENQLLGSENIRLNWAFYNNIVEDVKNLMQKNTKSMDPNADTIELIKKATVEQLQKMGINFDNLNQNENSKNSTNDHQNNKFIPTNLAASPDLSFRMNSVAMKYVSETAPDIEYHNKKSPVNDISFRSNCNNVSIATLQYMERYQLFPNSEQRYGGNSVGFNKHEENVAQEHRHRTLKPNQGNDKSFIY